jgi:ABC-type antimicrobial peptide transport system ATPase subunit
MAVSFLTFCPPALGATAHSCQLAGKLLPGLTLSACTLCLQVQKEGNVARSLPLVCQILFTFSSQLQRLSVSMRHERVSCHGLVSHLLGKLIVLMKLLPSLESLAVAVPHNSDLSMLAGTVPSLQKLKVHGMSSTCKCCACVKCVKGVQCTAARLPSLM